MPVPIVEANRQQDHQKAGGYRPDNHFLGIILNLLLVFCANAGNNDHDEGHQLTIGQELIYRQVLK